MKYIISLFVSFIDLCHKEINYSCSQMERALKNTVMPSEPVTVCQADTGGLWSFIVVTLPTTKFLAKHFVDILREHTDACNNLCHKYFQAERI